MKCPNVDKFKKRPSEDGPVCNACDIYCDRRRDLVLYLSWWHDEADFGPAEGDVRAIMNDEYFEDTGKYPPKGYHIYG